MLLLHQNRTTRWRRLRIPSFRRYLAGNIFAALGMQMQTVAVGWEVWERTHDALLLGLVGLVQFLPVITLLLPAGHAADRFPRKRILFCCLAILVSSSIGLAVLSATQGDIRLMFVCLLATGIARAFQQPTKASFLPQIVPRERFNNAVTWSTGGFHLASVLGPAVGGLVIGVSRSAALVYALDASATLVFLLLLLGVTSRPQVLSTSTISVSSLLAGLRFVYHTKTILAAITLDMFAVLLGGATMLFPIFASPDMLNVGPDRLGLDARSAGDRCAGHVICAGLSASHRARRPGLVVVGRGIWRGDDRLRPVAIVSAVAGGAVSHGRLRQYQRGDSPHAWCRCKRPTPCAAACRRSTVLFIGASNELGGFESGLAARLTSPVISVVLGGAGTLVVVSIASVAWPEIRRYGRLDGTPRGTPELGAQTPTEAVTSTLVNKLVCTGIVAFICHGAAQCDPTDECSRLVASPSLWSRIRGLVEVFLFGCRGEVFIVWHALARA